MLPVTRCLSLLIMIAGAGLALPCKAQDELRLHGSQTVGQRLAPVLVTDWMNRIGYSAIAVRRPKPGITRVEGTRDGSTLTVEILGNGGGAGFRDLVGGDAEIAMMARPLTARERDAGWQLGNLDSPDQEFVVSVQALVAVVNARNPLTSLSTAQLAAIAQGRVRDWKAVGGAPGAIRQVVASAGTGLAELQAQVLGPTTDGGARRVDDPAAILAAVAADPLAIGWVDYRRLPPRVRALAVRAAGRDIPADAFGIASEDYPLTRRLVLRTGQLVTALGRSFVNYTVSEAGQRTLAAHRMMALLPGTTLAAAPASAPDEYGRLVAGSQRLPMALRFGDGFSILDSRSTQDVQRLKEFMERGGNRARRLILVGFSGREATPYQAVVRSTERADLAAQALADVGLYPMRVRGLGAIDAATSGRGDLRVEVWMR